ncbi:SLC13 family permease [Desulfovibrio inopinatus]|uniref:SLC13 family permease n=1 Tax=Desulfovibrio inopinatus TaxID=102109 RepID=UPI00040864B9|nr:SLC13 family permease [Desulfovibrio inopinatus]
MTAPTFTLEMASVLIVTALTVVFFVTEWLRVDVVAIVVMVILPIMGHVSGPEAFSGLSSTAVLSIIAVIIMGRGLDHSGVVNRLVNPLMRLAGSSRTRCIALLSGTIAIISSFMQNVGAAALFLPAIKRLSVAANIPLGQLLMPIGFAAILGGTVTLVGSSPLIMLNDLLTPFQLAPFNLFDVTPIGLLLVGTGIAYFLVLGRKVLPGTRDAGSERPPSSNPVQFYPELGNLYELRYPRGSGPALQVVNLCDPLNVHTVALSPDGGHDKIIPPDRDMAIPSGSVFAVYGTRDHVQSACGTFGFELQDDLDVFANDLSLEQAGVVEAIISPRSTFVGRSLSSIRFRHNYHMAPLAVSRGDHPVYTGLGHLVLEAGDIILMHAAWKRFSAMRPQRDLLFAQPMDREIIQPEKAGLAIACFAMATILVMFSGLPLAVCLMAGAAGMIVTGVLDIDEAYRGVDWRTVFLLAGLIPLGIAMQKTGAATYLATKLLAAVGTPSPGLLFFILGAVSTIVTLVVSNVGATVLLVPLAVDMANSTGADPRLAALTVALAASNSFLLPTHQVNALYMGPGGYTSRDFIKAGLPLTIVFLIVLTLCMTILY